MNTIKATITEVKKCENISALSFYALGTRMSMVALDLNKKFQVGITVTLKTEAKNISLSKEIQGKLSISNQLQGEVYEVTYGTILCNVKIKIEDSVLESIITQKSALEMDIKVGDKIIALIKANDVSIEPSEG